MKHYEHSPYLPALCSPQGASLVARRVKRLPAMWETCAPSLGQEDPLEKEMATHSNVLAWRIPWTVELSVRSLSGSRKSLSLLRVAAHFPGE